MGWLEDDRFLFGARPPDCCSVSFIGVRNPPFATSSLGAIHLYGLQVHMLQERKSVRSLVYLCLFHLYLYCLLTTLGHWQCSSCLFHLHSGKFSFGERFVDIFSKHPTVAKLSKDSLPDNEHDNDPPPPVVGAYCIHVMPCSCYWSRDILTHG